MRIGLDSVRAFESEEGYFRRVGGEGRGRPEFARRTHEGRLDLYERTGTYFSGGTPWMVSTPSGPAPSLTPGGVHQQRTGYFATEGGALRPVAYDALREALVGDAESMRHLDQYRRLGYVQWGLVGVGTSTALVGATQIGEDGDIPALAVVGVAVAAAAWIPQLMRPPKLREAIRAYNR